MALHPTAIVSHLTPGQRQQLATPMASQASSTLRTMAATFLFRPTLMPDLIVPLVEGGYMKQSLGGYGPTESGLLRAAMESTP